MGLQVIDLNDVRLKKKSLIVNVQNTCWYFNLEECNWQKEKKKRKKEATDE